MNKLKEFREKNALKQSDVARQIGVSQGTLSGWENGRYPPDYAGLQKLAVIYGATIDNIWSESDNISFNITTNEDEPAQISIEKPKRPDKKPSSANLSDDAIQLAQKYMLMNPSAQAVIRSIVEYELRQDTYMRTEIEGLKIEYEKQIRDLKMQIPEEAEA